MPALPLNGPLFDHWRTAPDAESAFDVLNPATGEVITSLRKADAEEVDATVAKATAAFETWGRTTPAERSAALLALADRLEAAGEDFARLESANVGKPLAQAREEIAYDADVLRFMAGAVRVPHAMATGEYLPGRTSLVRRDPLGVVGLITPWNYPLMEALWKLAPALAAGNTVVIKPATVTPLSTVLFTQMAQEVLPEGVLNLVVGDRTAGQVMVDHPDIRLISLTGDGATGKKVAASAAATLKRVHLELGGKGPAVVFADAQLETAATELAQTAFLNAGQDCSQPCRVIVEDSAYEAFTAAYLKTVAGLVCGAPDDEDSHFGPVISQRHLESVEGFVERARAAGATVLAGGRRIDRPGFFHEPTVLTDVRQDDEIIQSEVFGPVVTIQRAADDEEMLAMANGVEYGLAASVWTSDVDRALRFTRDLAFGTVWLNQHLVVANEMPFGGFGQSGYGKELSAHAIDEYSQVKHIMLKAAHG
ncbi:aminobutyraldehyde dehydrogenase [Streptomyces sp. MB09-02B]|uniref:aminobutyraldehyde dehydrogenase n=1 Tax=Streptomyces sp. MB09-02B TaxID=3028667 RepID=UPI0029A43DBE|nr:aminobutyraldehyde dehydrogenase [Streptomyces sp. MB09-02B]MDX3640503.1 aminobutyraldehyde dehydrogenase [Streptomyces sp. MB09-02B]